MARIHIALQTPSVEMPVQSKPDCSGKTEKMIVEFRRYPSDESDKKLVILNKLVDSEAPEILSGDDLTAWQAKTVADIKAFLKAEIVSLKKVPIYVENANKDLVRQVVEDTKKAKSDDELWGDSSNCLDFLLDMVLDSTPWSSPILQAQFQVLTNTAISQKAEIKN